LAALSVAVIAGLLTAAAPIALKWLIDALSGAVDEPGLFAPTLLLFAYVLSHWLSKSCNELRLVLRGVGEQRLHRNLSRRLFRHLMVLPLAFHLGRKTGAIAQALTDGLTGYRLVLNHIVSTIIPVATQMIAVASALLILDRPIFLAIIGGAVLAYAIVFAVGVARINTPARDVSATNIKATATMTDSVLNFEAVKYSGAEANVVDEYDRALTQLEDRWQGLYSRRAKNGLLAAAIFGLALAATSVLAFQGVRAGTMTVGDFVMVVTFVLLTMGPVERLGYAMRDLAQGRAFIQQFLALVNEAPECDVVEGDGNVPQATGTRGALSFENVSFGYNAKTRIHHDISFRCEPGQSVALIGPSGCGKSSIVRLLFRFFDADDGEIVLDGLPISKWPIAELRREIAVVPQDTILLDDTIARNISLGFNGLPMEEIEKAADLANIHDVVISLPDGYQTVVGERGLKLSGGEKQRIAIARAVLKKPRVFVFDEATSALDTHTEQAILNNLIRVSEGVTSLFIAHRLSTIVHADQILVIDDGRIVERGSHDALLDQNGMYASLWRSQHRSTGSKVAIAAQGGSMSRVRPVH